MNAAINEKLEAIRRQLGEGRPTASAPVSMTGFQLMRAIENCFYPPMNSLSGYARESATPTALLDAMEKLDYAKDDLAVLRDYFKRAAELEAARNKASRALQNIREENYVGDGETLSQVARAY